MNPIRKSFVYPVLNEQHRQYGASLLQAPIIRNDGDWRPYVPTEEAQQRRGIEPSDCFIEGQQHAIASIHEEKWQETNNWSARFNALLANGTESGGDPVAGGDSIRHDGLIAEELMTYEGLNNWQDFHSWKGTDETHCRAAGKADLYLYDRNFGVVITREMPLTTKFQVLRQGLLRSPMPISVYGVSDGQGSYIQKPDGVSDTHLVEALYVSPDSKITILDTYEPFIKVLPADYNMDFGMMWTVEKKTTDAQKKSWFDGLVAFFKAFLTPQQSEEAITSIKPVFMPEPKYKWDSVEDIRHSIRVIGDEEGLSVLQKDLVCDICKCESGFSLTAHLQNTDSHKSVDRGLFQWNNYWNPTITDDMAYDPETASRLACKEVKSGNAVKLWKASMGCWNKTGKYNSLLA